MKDARLYLNRKRLSKKQDGGQGLRTKVSGRAIDARKILNLKRSSKQPKKGFSLRTSKASTSSGVPVIHKSFSVHRKEPEKRVEVAGDGNIWITSKSKQPMVSQASKFGSNFVQRPRWTPADLTMDNLEHVGIEDVIDMDALPPAVLSTGQPRSLSMRNTMVADHVASTSTSHNARVIVSNLQPSVSKQDLLELFGDIGIIRRAELSRPGSALVEFHNFEDAAEAINTYHNRLLDGQPMQCHLQSGMNRTSVSQRLGDRIQSSTHLQNPSPPLVSNPRSRYNPRDVRFTVKLA